jgi:hypothetical protein
VDVPVQPIGVSGGTGETVSALGIVIRRAVIVGASSRSEPSKIENCLRYWSLWGPGSARVSRVAVQSSPCPSMGSVYQPSRRRYEASSPAAHGRAVSAGLGIVINNRYTLSWCGEEHLRGKNFKGIARRSSQRLAAIRAGPAWQQQRRTSAALQVARLAQRSPSDCQVRFAAAQHRVRSCSCLPGFAAGTTRSHFGRWSQTATILQRQRPP